MSLLIALTLFAALATLTVVALRHALRPAMAEVRVLTAEGERTARRQRHR